MNDIYDNATPLSFSAFVCQGAGNAPSANNAWLGIQYRNASGAWGFQLTLSFGNNALYIRRRTGSSTFTAWAAIQ